MAICSVFISYHHNNEQAVVDHFIETLCGAYDVVTDRSPERAADSEDATDLSQACRDAIDGASVTIVLIGKQTGHCRFVDWEIRHTLAMAHGLVGIAAPRLPNTHASIPERLLDNLNSGYAKWYKYPPNASSLKGMIDNAFEADAKKIDNSRDKMKMNTS